MTIKQNYINHFALVLDGSYSMSPFTEQVIKVADDQIAHWAKKSKELDQETRVTVYVLSDSVTCLIYDKDVLRMPSLKGLYRASGNTALIKASIQALDDLSKTPELYGDHAFLMYVLTDGEENASGRLTPADLSKRIAGLKDNWTVAAFVPNRKGEQEAIRFGFPAGNIAVWETTSQGYGDVGKIIRDTTDMYMTARTAGTRSYKNLFNIDTTSISKQAVTATLAKLHPGQYRIYDVKDKTAIAPFVETQTKRSYRMGEGYYELSKPEKIQGNKAVVLFDKAKKGVYVGKDARDMLKLPDYEVRVAPASHPDYTIFVQSLSVNRNLMPGTKLLLLS